MSMKDTLTGLVKALVDQPEEVTVAETSEEGRTVFTISVHPDDMGKIIGRGGRIIRAVRDLMKIIATKKGAYIDVIVAEERPPESNEPGRES